MFLYCFAGTPTIMGHLPIVNGSLIQQPQVIPVSVMPATDSTTSISATVSGAPMDISMSTPNINGQETPNMSTPSTSSQETPNISALLDISLPPPEG